MNPPGPFEVEIFYSVSNGIPKPQTGTLSCPKKDWNWKLKRRDVGIFQAVSQLLRQLPGKLLDDADRFNHCGRPDLSRTGSSVEGLKTQLESWWKEAHKNEAEDCSVETNRQRFQEHAGYGHHTVYKVDLSNKSVHQVASKPPQMLRQLSDNDLLRPSEPSFKRFPEVLGEMLCLLSDYSTVFQSRSTEAHARFAETILESAGWMAAACTVYLKFFTSAWIKTSSPGSMIGEVLVNEMGPMERLVEAEWRHFIIPRFQRDEVDRESNSTPPPVNGPRTPENF